MAFDKDLMLRAAAAGNLTADETGTYVNLGAPLSIQPMVVRITVPQLAETSDTIVPKVNMSVDGSGAGEYALILPTITKANVDLGIKEYFFTLPRNPYQYVSVDLDITDADTGGDFNAGVVLVGLVPAGRYDKI